MTNDQNTQMKYDLEERTAKLGEDVIRFCRSLPRNEITRPIINQLIKCGTSIGANYCEADDSESPKDFKHKIGICKKEARETKHFIRMTVIAVPGSEEQAQKLWKEAKEINLIFNSIYRKCK